MLWLEDIETGVVRHAGAHRLEEADIIAFARQWDPQPIHVDPEAARASPFGGITASSAHVFCIIGALFNRLEPIALICGLKNEFTMRIPARGGDALTLSIACEDKRDSASKPDRGIARFVYHLHNQSGDTVADGAVSFLIWRRGHPAAAPLDTPASPRITHGESS